MMIGSGLFLSDNTSYPNWMGLFPTIGTVLVIRTSIGFVNEILLNNKISLFFGKISYSLYLFHNPFLFYSGFFLSRSVDLGIAFLITLIVTKFIEEKVRVSRWKPMVWILSGIMLFILMIATLIYVYPSKWSYGTF
jgi:peptidoglycan/LPS O-acetylase OafA/YrhL